MLKVMMVLLSLACASQAVAKPRIASDPRVIAENAIKEALKDPDSARFTKVTVSKDCDGKRYVSGFENAKNSYGGYVGPRIFRVRVTGHEAYIMQANGMSFASDDEARTANVCQGLE